MVGFALALPARDVSTVRHEPTFPTSRPPGVRLRKVAGPRRRTGTVRDAAHAGGGAAGGGGGGRGGGGGSGGPGGGGPGGPWSWLFPQWGLPRRSWHSEDGLRERWLRQKCMVVQGVQVLGREDLPLRVVYQITDCLIGRRPELREIEEKALQLQAWYQENGYYASLVQVAALPTSDYRVLVFRAIEPKLMGINLYYKDSDPRDAPEQDKSDDNTDALVQGARDVGGLTKPDTVMQVMGLKPGVHFRWMPDAMARLRGSNLFTNVETELAFADVDRVYLELTVVEAKYIRIEPQVGLRNDSELFGDINLVHSNLFGRLNFGSVQWERRVGESLSAFSMEYSDAFIGSPFPLTSKLRLFREPRRFRGVGDRDGGKFCLGTSPWRTTTDADACVRLERVSNFEGSHGDAESQFVGSLRYSTTGNMHRRATHPSYKQTLEYERTLEPFDELVSFWKSSWNIIGRVPTRVADSHLAMRLVQKSGRDVPVWEKHHVGGPTTVRGFDFAELGLLAGSTTTSVEFRVPVSPHITGVAFTDRLYATGPNAEAHGSFGIGLRIDEFVALDYAWNENGAGHWHVNLGPVMW